MQKHLALVLIGAFIVLTLPICAQGHVMHTNRPRPKILPLPKEEGVFHFIIYGDRTGGKPEGVDILRQAVVDTNLLGPDFVMTVGDLIQGYNSTAAWLPEMKEYSGVMDKLDCPWFPVAGNHDIYYRGKDRPKYGHEANYERHFGPLWYWFEHKDCAFFTLYSDEGSRQTGEKGWNKPTLNQFSDEQLAWLEAELKKTANLDHVFIFLHHPKWQQRYKGSNWDRVHTLLVQTGNCKAVFAGHIHQMIYDGKRDGIEYFALAVTGGHISAEVRGQGALHHMNLVTVRKNRITHVAIPVGEVIDPRTFTQDFVDDVKNARKISAVITGERITIGAKGLVDGDLHLRFANPCAGTVEVTYSFDVASPAWGFGVDHAHLTLKPGETRNVVVPVARKPVGFSPFEVPEITTQVEYLGPTTRFALPEQRTGFEFEIANLSAAETGTRGALAFDGSSSVAFQSDRLELPDGPFTLEGWMKARSLNGRRGLMTKAESSEFGLFVSDGQPRFSVHLGDRYWSAEAGKGRLVVGQWYHIAGVFDGVEVRIYVDGKLEQGRAGKGSRTRNQLPFLVGADVGNRGKGGSGFDGWIDEVRLSKIARYSGDSFSPEKRFEADADTVMLIHGDYTVGPFVLDQSEVACHGRIRGRARVEKVTR